VVAQLKRRRLYPKKEARVNGRFKVVDKLAVSSPARESVEIGIEGFSSLRGQKQGRQFIRTPRVERPWGTSYLLWQPQNQLKKLQILLAFSKVLL
jgi:hypothetical protein